MSIIPQTGASPLGPNRETMQTVAMVEVDTPVPTTVKLGPRHLPYVGAIYDWAIILSEMDARSHQGHRVIRVLIPHDISTAYHGNTEEEVELQFLSIVPNRYHLKLELFAIPDLMSSVDLSRGPVDLFDLAPSRCYEYGVTEEMFAPDVEDKRQAVIITGDCMAAYTSAVFQALVSTATLWTSTPHDDDNPTRDDEPLTRDLTTSLDDLAITLARCAMIGRCGLHAFTALSRDFQFYDNYLAKGELADCTDMDLYKAIRRLYGNTVSLLLISASCDESLAAAKIGMDEIDRVVEFGAAVNGFGAYSEALKPYNIDVYLDCLKYCDKAADVLHSCLTRVHFLSSTLITRHVARLISPPQNLPADFTGTWLPQESELKISTSVTISSRGCWAEARLDPKDDPEDPRCSTCAAVFPLTLSEEECNNETPFSGKIKTRFVSVAVTVSPIEGETETDELEETEDPASREWKNPKDKSVGVAVSRLEDGGHYHRYGKHAKLIVQTIVLCINSNYL